MYCERLLLLLIRFGMAKCNFASTIYDFASEEHGVTFSLNTYIYSHEFVLTVLTLLLLGSC